MRKTSYRLLVAVVIIGAVLLGLRIVFPSDEVRIGKLLSRLERASNVAAGESQLSRVARIQLFEELFAPQCEVAVDTYDYGKLHFAGRDELLQAASAAVLLQQAVTVKFPQTGIRVAQYRTNAVVEIASTVHTSQRSGGTLLLLKLLLDKDKGSWRITRVESIRSLQM